MARMNEWCHTCEWVMSHLGMSHVTHVNDWYRTYECIMSHMWMSHAAHRNSCHTYEWRKTCLSDSRPVTYLFTNKLGTNNFLMEMNHDLLIYWFLVWKCAFIWCLMYWESTCVYAANLDKQMKMRIRMNMGLLFYELGVRICLLWMSSFWLVDVLGINSYLIEISLYLIEMRLYLLICLLGMSFYLIEFSLYLLIYLLGTSDSLLIDVLGININRNKPVFNRNEALCTDLFAANEPLFNRKWALICWIM